MKDLSNFIGIPHFFGQSSFSQCDCAGLARLFYAHQGHQEKLRDGKPEDETQYKHQPLRMLRYLMKNMDRIDNVNDLAWSDIVVTKVLGEHHVGIYLEYQRVLSMEVPCIQGKTKSCIYKGSQWIPHFIAGFRSRKEVTDEPSNIDT